MTTILPASLEDSVENGCHVGVIAQKPNGELDTKTVTSVPEPDMTEAIAIIGFSLRFPQEATTAETFWNMLLEKRCAMTEWPRDRLNIDGFYHPDKDRNDAVSEKSSSVLRSGTSHNLANLTLNSLLLVVLIF